MYLFHLFSYREYHDTPPPAAPATDENSGGGGGGCGEDLYDVDDNNNNIRQVMDKKFDDTLLTNNTAGRRVHHLQQQRRVSWGPSVKDATPSGSCDITGCGLGGGGGGDDYYDAYSGTAAFDRLTEALGIKACIGSGCSIRSSAVDLAAGGGGVCQDGGNDGYSYNCGV